MVGFVTAAALLLSVRQIWVRALPSIGYAGMSVMSRSWTEPPDDENAEWRLSEGQVAPPPVGATRADLVAWLKQHYPVLALDLPANAAEGSEKSLDLGGGPPRRLYVEPGRGLVGRRP